MSDEEDEPIEGEGGGEGKEVYPYGVRLHFYPFFLSRTFFLSVIYRIFNGTAVSRT